MKKMMITLGLVTLAGFTSFGQAEKATKTSYTSLGPVAGFGHSWLSNRDYQQFKATPSLGIGLIYSRYEHWGWGATLMASHEGFSNEYILGPNRYRETYNPVYVRLTPKAYYFFGDYKSSVRPKIYVGPSVGVKVQEDYRTKNLTNNTTDVVMNTSNSNQMFRTMDFGAQGGAGVNIKLGTYTWLNLDATYYQGLMDVTRDNGETNMNQNLGVNVGVMMGL